MATGASREEGPPDEGRSMSADTSAPALRKAGSAGSRDGASFGNGIYKGRGFTRTCGKCLRHVPESEQAGAKVHRLFGWVCVPCSTKKAGG